MRRPHEFLDFPPALQLQAGWGPYRAVVRQVIDGDTLDVLVDLGLNTYSYETIRVRGVDAAERYTEPGKLASAFTRTLLPPGTAVVLVTHKDPVTFGRYVADVRLVQGQQVVSLAELLVAQGHAVRSQA